MFSRHLIVSILLLIGSSASANAECADANPIARLICEDDKLRGLEGEIQARYESALSRMPASDRPFLEAEQSDWQSRRQLICSKTTEPGSTDEKRRECLESFATNRLDRLSAWPSLGRVTILVDAPADEKACALALDRSNLAWRKDIEWGTDRYEPLVPARASEPAWAPFGGSRQIMHARFDFLNDGTVRDVYSIESGPDWRSPFHWYVVVADGEEGVMRERATALAYDLLDRLVEFGNALQRESLRGFPRGEFYEVFGAEGKPASLQSTLITPTNSEFYQGDSTESRILLLDGITYVAATNHRRKAALFRPDKTGSLTTLCRHDAVPSRVEPSIRIVSTSFSCPAKNDVQPIAWEGDQWDMHAAIELNEWGGRRVVRRRLESAAARYANTRIYIGALDDSSPPERNAWQPMDVAAEHHDSAELVLTSAGPHILIDDWIPIRPDYMPLGRTYYRIVDNGLTEVCRETDETIPPPGYAVKN